MGNDVEPLGIRLPVGVGDWLRVRVNYAQGAPLYYYHLSREAPMTWTLIPAADGTSVAHIDDEGRLTTLAPGRAQIEVQYLGFKALTLLTVFEEPPAALEISPSHRTIDRGTELQLNATAHFDAAREWDMTERVTWSATDVGSESQVVAIDPSGKVRAMGVGMAEITATLSGKRASTLLMVVPPSRISSQRVGKALLPPDVYRLCRARVRQLWLPKLRELSGGAVKLKGESARRSAHLVIDVGGEEGPAIGVTWAPDMCEGPQAWWNGNFDWRVPSTPLEQMLTFAGNDCISYSLR